MNEQEQSTQLFNETIERIRLCDEYMELSSMAMEIGKKKDLFCLFHLEVLCEAFDVKKKYLKEMLSCMIVDEHGQLII